MEKLAGVRTNFLYTAYIVKRTCVRIDKIPFLDSHFTARENIVVNGCFTLAKTAAPLELRFIVNAQPANAAFKEPFPLALPSPEHLGRLVAPGKWLWFKRDLSNYYHQLALPKWLCRFFGLPRLTRALQLRKPSA